MAVKRLNLWSGPRNVSTALMYSFAQRRDTRVVDEPFYGHYLSEEAVEHPGREEVLKSQSPNPGKVISELLQHRGKEILFIKNMAHHMTAMDQQLHLLFEKCTSIFLIREPREMLLSYTQKIADPTMRDVAYRQQYELFKQVKSYGQTPHVIDSRELLKDPRSVLSTLCRQLGLSFEESMLHWEAGAIPEDGVWAKYWYHGVHHSTGFKPYEPKTEPLPDHLRPLYEECKPIYDQLNKYSIKA